MWGPGGGTNSKNWEKAPLLPINISTIALNLSYFFLMSQTIQSKITATWGRVPPWSCDHVTMDLALTGSTASLTVQQASKSQQENCNRIFKNRFHRHSAVFSFKDIKKETSNNFTHIS